MGYRSDVVIAIHKSIMARALITNELPSLLREEPSYQSGDALYWKMEGLKWYSEYKDVIEVEAYFDKLDAEPCIFDQKEPTFSTCVFGAMRMGEEVEDIETWGQPDQYDISLYQQIDCPSV